MLLLLALLPNEAGARPKNVYYQIPQGEYKQWFDSGVKIERTKDHPSLDLRRFSEDGKRWFAITYALTNLGPSSGQRLDYDIVGYAGKDYLTHITLYDIYSDGVPEVRWLNDKLMYIQFWWRSTVGGYMIYDMDNDYIVVREMMFVGAPPVTPQHPRLNAGRGYQE